MIRIDSSWSGLPQAPNIIAPRHILLTETPVRPSGRCSMVPFVPRSVAGYRPAAAADPPAHLSEDPVHDLVGLIRRVAADRFQQSLDHLVAPGSVLHQQVSQHHDAQVAGGLGARAADAELVEEIGDRYVLLPKPRRSGSRARKQSAVGLARTERPRLDVGRKLVPAPSLSHLDAFASRCRKRHSLVELTLVTDPLKVSKRQLMRRRGWSTLLARARRSSRRRGRAQLRRGDVRLLRSAGHRCGRPRWAASTLHAGAPRQCSATVGERGPTPAGTADRTHHGADQPCRRSRRARSLAHRDRARRRAPAPRPPARTAA